MSELDEKLSILDGRLTDESARQTVCAARARIATLEAENADLHQAATRGKDALHFIAMQGYRRCDIPACNCPYWHGGNASERLHEIGEELGDETQGKTILKAVEARGAENADLRTQLAERDEEANGWRRAIADLTSTRLDLTEKLAERDNCLVAIISAWDCSDGGAGGVESIAAALDAARPGDNK